MQIVILSARPGWHTDELCRALAERGHTGCVLPYERLAARFGGVLPARGSGGGAHTRLGAWRNGGSRSKEASPASGALLSGHTSILAADAVLARIVPGGSLEQIIFRVDALHWIEECGIPVMNSADAIERSVDKFYTTALLHNAGLPVPETVVCEGADDGMAAVREMGDAVIKPLFGSMGLGIVRVSDPDLAFRVVRALEQLRAVFYVQRAVSHAGCDVRVFIVGGRVLGAIERQAAPGEWRTNVARGGSTRPFVLPPEWEQLALRAAAQVGAAYAGVDLLPSRDGDVYVLEVNAIPGWRGLQEATRLDVAGAIVEHLLERVRATAPLTA